MYPRPVGLRHRRARAFPPRRAPAAPGQVHQGADLHKYIAGTRQVHPRTIAGAARQSAAGPGTDGRGAAGVLRLDGDADGGGVLVGGLAGVAATWSQVRRW